MRITRKVYRNRIMTVYIIILLAFLAIFVRLAYVKILASTPYYEKALELWTRSAPLSGKRGNIYDRNGKLIVGNQLTPTIISIPTQVKNKEETAKKLAEVLNCNSDNILKHLKKIVSVEIIKPEGQKISVEQALEVSKLKLDGIYIVGDTSRYYPYGNLLAQVIGIVGIDNQGITGIEYIYEKYLKGTGGALNIFTDAHGDIISDLTSYYVEGKAGNDIYLTIDLDIQIALERILDNAVARYNPEQIISLVMHPQTSEVLAMASRPTFSPAHYQDYEPEIYNRNLPIWYSFEPGSVFKITTYSAGLEENVFKLDEEFYDPGYSIIDGVRIRDWKVGGHGRQTFLQVIQNSCNPGFMAIGQRLGKEKLFKYMRDYGYGAKTGIDLLGESTGILFNIDNIGNVELATSSFGQGNSVTALQLVNASMAAVNGGKLYQPYILSRIKDGDKVVKENDPKFIRQVVSEETSKKVAYALETVVSLGTGRGSYIEGFRVGGKTGTAQVAVNGSYAPNQYILSYLGMAPMNDPQVAAYIAIHNAKNTIQYGGVVVAPMVKELLMEAFTSLKIPLQDGGVELEARYYIDKAIYTVEDYVGMKVKNIPHNYRYQFKIEGNGNTVIAQIPEAGQKLIEGGYVILYT